MTCWTHEKRVPGRIRKLEELGILSGRERQHDHKAAHTAAVRPRRPVRGLYAGTLPVVRRGVRTASPRDPQLLTATKQWIGALTDDERQRVLDHWTNLAGAEHTARLAAV